MLKTVKKSLRITTSALDDEVSELIAACIADLRRVGIATPKGRNINAGKVDPLILRAVILYAKANFGYDENSERYQKAYDALVVSLCLSGDYATAKGGK